MDWKILAAFSFLLVVASVNAANNGDACAPGGPDGNCPAYGNHPGFCLVNSAQKACNCFKDGAVCTYSSDCCQSGAAGAPLGCNEKGKCKPLAKIGQSCNPDTNNCEINVQTPTYCKLDKKIGTGTCVAKLENDKPCTLNLECKSGICRVTSTGLNCSLTKTPIGKPCVRPAAIYMDPEENECVDGAFCRMNPDGKSAKCDAKLPNYVIGDTITKDTQCQNGNFCGYGGFCWLTNKPMKIYAVCISKDAGQAPSTRCYATDDCYTGECLPSGYCRQFQLKKIGEACSANMECKSEICKTDPITTIKKCSLGSGGDYCYYDPLYDGKQSAQCIDGYECSKNGAHGLLPDDVRGECLSLKRGSYPQAYTRRDSAPSITNSAFGADMGIFNSGDDPTDAMIKITYKLLDSSGLPAKCLVGGATTGCVLGGGGMLDEASISVQAPVENGTESLPLLASFVCPNQSGAYVIFANITDFGGNKLSPHYDFAYASKYTQVYCSAAIGTNVTGNWNMPVFIALMINILILALIYLLGRSLSSQNLLSHAHEEAGALLVTVVVAVFMLTLLAYADTLAAEAACSADSSGSCSIHESIIGKAQARVYKYDMSGTVNDAQKALSEVSAEASKSGSCNFLGVGFSVPGCSSWGIARGPLTQLMSASGFAIMDQTVKDMLLQLAAGPALNILLPLGILLRALRISRQAGSTLIALGLALYFVLPFSILFGYALVDKYIEEVRADAALKARIGGVLSPGIPLGIYSCDGIDPDENALVSMLDRLIGSSDGIIFQVIVNGLFVTFVAVAITFASVRFFGQLLGAEIEVYQIARFS